MSEQPRNWERELADIDRVIAQQQGNAPAGGSAPVGGSPPVPAAPRPTVPAGIAPPRRRSVALTWFWVALAVGLAAALVIWPYQRSCGLELFFYLGAAGITALVAVLGALASWSHRRPFAHVLALLVMAWAATVAVREVLPRVGYARTARTWMCEATGTTTPTRAAPAQTTPRPTAPAQTSPAHRRSPHRRSPHRRSPHTTQPAPTQPAPTQPAPAQPSPAQPSPARP